MQHNLKDNKLIRDDVTDAMRKRLKQIDITTIEALSLISGAFLSNYAFSAMSQKDREKLIQKKEDWAQFVELNDAAFYILEPFVIELEKEYPGLFVEKSKN